MWKTHKIPDRWEKYGHFGDVIKGTNILPLKVPLQKRLITAVPKKDRFTPMDFIEKLESMKYKLGLLIDLTNTSKYYNPDFFIERGVQYVKIFTQGHVVPSEEVVHRFQSALMSFKKENKDSDLIIGVHCTHGVNRTGYLICRYLIEHEGYKPKDALKAFEEARGYPVERKNYLEDLLHLNERRKEHGHLNRPHPGHSLQQRRNDFDRTRNFHHPHGGEFQRGNQQHFQDPYYWNGGGPEVAHMNTFQMHPPWNGPFQDGEGSMRRDGGVDYRERWDAWEGHDAHGGWDRGPWINMNYNGPDWQRVDTECNWTPFNYRTPQHNWNRGYRRTMRNTPY